MRGERSSRRDGRSRYGVERAGGGGVEKAGVKQAGKRWEKQVGGNTWQGGPPDIGVKFRVWECDPLHARGLGQGVRVVTMCYSNWRA